MSKAFTCDNCGAFYAPYLPGMAPKKVMRPSDSSGYPATEITEERRIEVHVIRYGIEQDYCTSCLNLALAEAFKEES